MVTRTCSRVASLSVVAGLRRTSLVIGGRYDRDRRRGVLRVGVA